jgi:PAS domain S-box-containing protein
MEHKKIKVLAIDDNPDNLITVKALIHEAFPDVLTLTATSGAQGLTLARAEDPDVVLLDIVMPDMDGFAVCLALKADETLRAIPVVFVTALKGDKENRIRALEAGGEGFLNKPIDQSELAAQIRAMVKIKATHIRKQDAKLHLEKVVAERTHELLKELEERKKTEEELVKTKRRYRLLFNCGNDAIFVHKIIDGKPGLYTDVNDIACEQLGYSREELLTMSQEDIVPKEMGDAQHSVYKTLQQTGRAVFEMIHVCKSGKLMPVEISTRVFMDGAEPYTLSIVRDISERKLAEKNLRDIESRLKQSEKMEAIGALAGGIAHDFNNVLGGIIGYTDMSLDLVDKDSLVEKNLRKVLKAADRAKHLVQQILTFSRQSNQQASVIALRPIIKEVMELLTASIPSTIRLESDLHKDVRPVLADPTKIHEMLLNLATNAVHAMDHKGTLTIRLYGEAIGREEFGRVGKILPGDYAIIEVSDTGSGMDAKTLERAFEPFFTTKPVGKGTGMGLSVVLGVVQLHGGDLQVKSVPDAGTTFKIFFPLSKELEALTMDVEKAPSGAGTERILFVDDENTLVEMAQEMLGNRGYKVTSMAASPMALKFIKEHSAEIDMLITDQTMPDMTGMELAKAARAIKKDLPVILCTGYSSEVNPERATALGISRLLMKPYGSREIRAAVREILDKGKG